MPNTSRLVDIIKGWLEIKPTPEKVTDVISDIENNNLKENLMKNSSCCGSISDGWIPSYPSKK
tara:strand:+ start:110 stop:298 length:189 start_codon:yes stop_codon:yes gene_type:complete